jgi:hypothetical protein
MSKARIFFIFGIVIAVLPYLGFPVFWKNLLLSLLGLGLAFFSYLIHRENKERVEDKKDFENFSENNFSEN